MDWEKLLATWGPAAPVILVLGKIVWDMVYRIIPKGFEEIRAALKLNNALSAKRHNQHMRAMRILLKDVHAKGAIAKVTPKRRRRSRRKPRPAK